MVIYAADLEKLFADFAGHFKVIEAAGGMVFNEGNEILLIYRRASWDLPKGKVDPMGGNPCELRQSVKWKEETGSCRHSLCRVSYKQPTIPIAEKSNKRVLKQTYWYRMQAPRQPLVPQAEEDIELAEWMSAGDFFAEEKPVFGNIRDLLLLFAPGSNGSS